jgi:hypothetical protein
MTKTPTYTFLSISTPKPGKMDDLIRIAGAPSVKADQHLDAVIARQVSVDYEKNTVVVWMTLDSKEALYEYLQTEHGKEDHGEHEYMSEIIETFTMYDLTPINGRL